MHVDEERVEPEMKHLLLQTRQTEREEEEEEEEGGEKESEFTWTSHFDRLYRGVLWRLKMY